MKKVLVVGAIGALVCSGLSAASTKPAASASTTPTASVAVTPAAAHQGAMKAAHADMKTEFAALEQDVKDMGALIDKVSDANTKAALLKIADYLDTERELHKSFHEKAAKEHGKMAEHEKRGHEKGEKRGGHEKGMKKGVKEHEGKGQGE
jgi:TolA-binding protein